MSRISSVTPTEWPTRSWRERLAAASALSWPVIWSTSVFALVSYVVASPAVSWSNPLNNLITVLSAQVTLFAVIFFGERLLLRWLKGSVRAWVTLALYVVASAIRGLALSRVEGMLDIEGTPSTAFRVIGSVTIMSSAVAVAVIAVASLDEHAEQLNQLLTERERLAQTQATISDLIAERTSALVTDITSELNLELEALDRHDPAEVVERLRHAAHDIVRPLSHELAYERVEFALPPLPERLKALDWRLAVRDATGPHTVSPLALALILTYMALNLALNLFGLRIGLPILIVAFLMIWSLGVVADRILPSALSGRGDAACAAIFTVTMLLIGICGGVICWWLARSDPNAWVWLPSALFVPAVAWVLAMTQAARHQYTTTGIELAELADQLAWELARANAAEWEQRRSLSRELHGPLQATINAAALRLHAAVQVGPVDPAFIDEIRTDIARQLRSLEVREDHADDARLAFARIHGTWQGLCEITFNVDQSVMDDVQRDLSCCGAMVDIVTEACSNSVRHGRATSIEVSITRRNDRQIELTLIDDGRLPSTASLPGLGMTVLSDVTLAWSLDSVVGGTRLTAVLPIEPAFG